MEPITRLWPAPKNLQGYGLDFYKRVGKQLVTVQILTELDRESFFSLASSYHLMMLCQDDINNFGVNVRGSKDEIKKNPALTSYKTASDIYNRLSRRFYLTPADRAGVTIERPKPKNGKEKFFQ